MNEISNNITVNYRNRVWNHISYVNIFVVCVEEQLFWEATDGNILNHCIIVSFNYRHSPWIMVSDIDVVVRWINGLKTSACGKLLTGITEITEFPKTWFIPGDDIMIISPMNKHKHTKRDDNML